MDTFTYIVHQPIGIPNVVDFFELRSTKSGNISRWGVNGAQWNTPIEQESTAIVLFGNALIHPELYAFGVLDFSQPQRQQHLFSFQEQEFNLMLDSTPPLNRQVEITLEVLEA